MSVKQGGKVVEVGEKSGSPGHRARVRRRVLTQDLSHFQNLELVETLLFYCNPRRDTKVAAQNILKASSNSILKMFFLEMEDLKKQGMDGVGEAFCVLLKVMKEIISRYHKDQIVDATFANLQQVGEYLVSCSAFLKHEEFRVLYLNGKNNLVGDAVVSKGTVNEANVYVRDIVKSALDKGATALVLSHNHPSGDFTPSSSDLMVTYNIKQALDLVGVVLHDHIIVSQNKFFSFKNEGLI